MTTDQCGEPVLIIGFNRPSHLAVLLDRLREVQPSTIYVALDGPRPGRLDDEEKVRACRDLVETIDWSCDVRTQFQEKNLGCGLGVSSALTWFFTHEPRGIILEDDIIPEASFFGFCAELLDRYEHDDRVFAISGCNFVPPRFQSHPEQPYRFSQVPHIWGWATWRRSWEQHRLDISGWSRSLPPTRLWARSGHSVTGAVYWSSIFELLARKQVDTWDGQLVFASMVARQLTATSNVNLVRNIGFNEEATHTKVHRDDLQPVEPITLPMQSAPVVLDAKADAWTRRHHFRATWRGMLDQGITYLNQRKARAT